MSTPAERPASLPHRFAGHPLIRRLADLAPSADLTLIGHRPPTDGPVRGMARSARERFQAITGFGLSPPPPRSEPPRRRSIEARNGAASVSYIEAGDPAGQKILFVHGTPGSARDWAGFLDVPAAGQHRLAIDRPGFGGSGPGKAVPSLSGQAQAVAAVLEDVGAPAVVVGSSYGGPVALRLAADRPELVAGLILIGGAADPASEKIHPIQNIAAATPVAALLPKAIVHSNAELRALRGELELLAGVLARIRASVTILHGLGDTLVPPGNAPYLVERLTGAARMRLVLFAQAGHFLHLLSPGHVEDALAELLASSGSRSAPVRRVLSA